MNMHGIMVPRTEQLALTGKARIRQAVRNFAVERRYFLLFVIAPTLLVAAYLYLFSADQFESEAHFLVRSTDQQQFVGLGLSQALTAATGLGAAQSESMGVADYLSSHDAVGALSQHDALVARFQRSWVDPLSRLFGDNPSPERLLKYYRKQVSVKYNTETGITTLKVHSFTPRDSYDIAERLLILGEERVNILNARSYSDAIALSGTQLAETEREIAASQTRLTNYRQTRSDIDPQALGQAQIQLVSKLTGELAADRAQLNAMGSMIDHRSPQYLALASRIHALEVQIGHQAGRLTGGERPIAEDIGGYEGLRLRLDFLSKRYEAEAASLDRARDQAVRQQLYLVRIVEPNLPVKALFPERGRILLTTLIALLVAYALGWLLVAGVREHAA